MKDNLDVKVAAKVMSKLGASKGGRARAEALTPEERRQIAQNAIMARWARTKTRDFIPQNKVLRATHTGVLEIGEISIPCAVLEDGRRVLSERGVVNSLGLYRSGAVHVRARDATHGAHLPLFLAHKNLQPFVDEELARVLLEPIWYLPPEGAKTKHKGMDAQLIPKICEVWLRARDADVLGKRQQQVAGIADMLMRGLAHVGIVALIDEATGYQEVRDRLALQEILDKFLRKEFAAWTRAFPVEFYKGIFRLRNWQWRGMKINRPQIVAHYTKDLVYTRLAPGILKELEARNPMNERGYRKAKHHQWLTEDVGHPALAQHLYAVIGLMRIADTWKEFIGMINKAYPKRGDNLEFDFLKEDGSEDV